MRNLYNFINLKIRIIVYLVCNRIHIYYRLRLYVRILRTLIKAYKD